MISSPSIPAAYRYLTHQAATAGFTVRIHRLDGERRTKSGYAIYFTIVLTDGRSGFIMKVCENRHGKVIGTSNVSEGQANCE